MDGGNDTELITAIAPVPLPKWSTPFEYHDALKTLLCSSWHLLP